MISLREMELTAGLSVAESLDGDTLAFNSLPTPIVIPCTASPVLKDFDMVPGGLSPKNTVQACQFRLAAIEGFATDAQLKKGLKCTLTTGIDRIEYRMQLWAGGLLSGGAAYQFMLVDENYRA